MTFFVLSKSQPPLTVVNAPRHTVWRVALTRAISDTSCPLPKNVRRSWWSFNEFLVIIFEFSGGRRNTTPNIACKHYCVPSVWVVWRESGMFCLDVRKTPEIQRQINMVKLIWCDVMLCILTIYSIICGHENQ